MTKTIGGYFYEYIPTGQGRQTPWSQPVGIFILLSAIVPLVFVHASVAGEKVFFRSLSSGVIDTGNIGPKLPCVIKAANGDILIQFNSGSDQWPGSTAYIVRSKDDGQTWGTPYKVVESLAHGESIHTNIGITVLPNGEILLPFTHGILNDGWQGYPTPKHTGQKWVHPYMVVSRDNGETFGPWIPIPGMEMASAYGRIVPVSNGKLLFPMWAFYKWTSSGSFPSNAHSGYAISSDYGRTWDKFVDLGPYGETSIVELPSGGFLASGKRNGANWATGFSRTTNFYLNTWDAMPINYSAGGKNASLHMSPKGTLLFFCSFDGNSGIYYSFDDGETWNESIRPGPYYGLSAVNLDDSRMMLVYAYPDASKVETSDSPWTSSKWTLGFTIYEERHIDIPAVEQVENHEHKSKNFFKQVGRAVGIK